MFVLIVSGAPILTHIPSFFCRRAQDEAPERAAGARHQGDHAGERAAGCHAGDLWAGERARQNPSCPSSFALWMGVSHVVLYMCPPHSSVPSAWWWTRAAETRPSGRRTACATSSRPWPLKARGTCACVNNIMCMHAAGGFFEVQEMHAYITITPQIPFITTQVPPADGERTGRPGRHPHGQRLARAAAPLHRRAAQRGAAGHGALRRHGPQPALRCVVVVGLGFGFARGFMYVC